MSVIRCAAVASTAVGAGTLPRKGQACPNQPALVAPSSSMVTDAKINADDTGRLVSGSDGFGNTIPPDTFVGAVSDTGPVSLSANASTTTASNNYAKPWTGTFQLLNDTGQPVILSEVPEREQFDAFWLRSSLFVFAGVAAVFAAAAFSMLRVRRVRAGASPK